MPRQMTMYDHEAITEMSIEELPPDAWRALEEAGFDPSDEGCRVTRVDLPTSVGRPAYFIHDEEQEDGHLWDGTSSWVSIFDRQLALLMNAFIMDHIIGGSCEATPAELGVLEDDADIIEELLASTDIDVPVALGSDPLMASEG